MPPCSKNSVPYPGKSFSFKLIKKSREIGLNCSLRNKNRKCHRQYFLHVRKVIRKLLRELSPRKSYRGGEKTWTLSKMTKIFDWLRFYLLIPHSVYFVPENTLSFTLFGRAGSQGRGKNPIFTNSTLSSPHTSVRLLHCRLVRIVKL